MTFPANSGQRIALVRMKSPGLPPEFRTWPMDGTLEENMGDLLAFIWAHLDGEAHQRQGWLWEA